MLRLDEKCGAKPKVMKSANKNGKNNKPRSMKEKCGNGGSKKKGSKGC